MRVSGARLSAGESGALAGGVGSAGWVVSLLLIISEGAADVGWGVDAAGAGWRGAGGVSGVRVSGAMLSAEDVALGGASYVWGSGAALSAGDVAPGVVSGGAGVLGALAGWAGVLGWVVSFLLFILLLGVFCGVYSSIFGG